MIIFLVFLGSGGDCPSLILSASAGGMWEKNGGFWSEKITKISSIKPDNLIKKLPSKALFKIIKLFR